MLSIKSEQEVTTGGVTYKVIQGGEFEDVDLVEVYRDGDENKTSIGAFQAHFIAYGYNVGEQDPTGNG